MNASKKFTLVEVMTALAVFSLFVVMLLQFFTAAGKLWHRSEKEVQLAGKANLILSTIENYVKNARTGSRYSPFYISNAVSSGDITSAFDIMKNNFKDGDRWEEDDDAFDADKSTKLIFAAPSDVQLYSDAGGFYILCFAQAQDKFVLRAVSDKVGASAFRNYLDANRNELGSLFGGDQRSFLGKSDHELASGEENDGKVTHLIADHVTRFTIYPYKLNDGFGSQSNPLELVTDTSEYDKGKTPNIPYAIMVEIAMLGDEDFLTWKTLCAGENNKEAPAARDFRTKNEKNFTRLILIGSPKEMN